tara:strand:+ start:458 stop:1057 length:600 start_codon:yes stop_codon:yes gene_type:complete
MTKYNALSYDFMFSRVMHRVREQVLELSGEVHGKKVLEIASGTGDQAKLYIDSGAIYTGVDLSKEMVERARKKLTGVRGIDLLCADATNLEYDDDHFDISTITLALHEMDPKTRSKVLEEMKRVSKGPLIVADYSAGARNPINNFGIKIVEWFAGGSHFAGYKDFMENGGVYSLVKRHELEVGEERFFAGKNIAILRLN